MTQRSDISRLLELWLVDDEPDVLPERVLGAVADRLPQARQLGRSWNLLGSWRAITMAASLAVLAAATAIGYALLQPPPASLPSPDASASPTVELQTPFVEETLRPIPSYSFPPAQGLGDFSDRITGRVQARGTSATVSLDLDGWYWPPDAMGFALMRGLANLDGRSLNLWALVQPPRQFPPLRRPHLVAVVRSNSGTGPDATIDVSYNDGWHGGLYGEAVRVAANAYDGRGRVSRMLTLPAGRAALVRTAVTIDGRQYDVTIYLVDLGDTTVELDFATSPGNFDALQAELLRVATSVRRED